MKQYAASAGLTGFYTGPGFLMVNLVNGITQGLADNQRVGDHLYLDRIHVKMAFSNGLGAGSNPLTTVRVLVFQFFGDNNTLPIPNSLLLNSSANAGPTYGAYSMFDIDHADQYRVMYDSGTMVIFGTQGLATSGASSAINYFVHTFDTRQAPDRNIRYYAAGAFGSNHIYLLVVSDQAHNAVVEPSANYTYAVRYTDA
jgi:hypothetical protein